MTTTITTKILCFIFIKMSPFQRTHKVFFLPEIDNVEINNHERFFFFYFLFFSSLSRSLLDIKSFVFNTYLVFWLNLAQKSKCEQKKNDLRGRMWKAFQKIESFIFLFNNVLACELSIYSWAIHFVLTTQKANGQSTSWISHSSFRGIGYTLKSNN